YARCSGRCSTKSRSLPSQRKIDIMPRVLIAGCGYLGRAVADLFVGRGWEVEGWTKSAESAQQLSTKPYPVLAVDLALEHGVLALGSDRFANQIHRDDATAAIQLLLQRGESAGGVYNVVDDEPILRSECYRWLATKLSRPLPPTGRSTSKQKRGESNKRVSNAKLRAIGWVPRYPSFADGMERSVLPNLDIENA